MQRAVSVLTAFCLLAGPALANDMSWVEKSNEHAQLELGAFAELAPGRCWRIHGTRALVAANCAATC